MTAAAQGAAAGQGARAAARGRGWRRPALWPRSLASRTALVVLLGLMAVQAGGLAIHTADQRLVRRGEMARGLGLHLLRFYRVVERAPPERRAEVVHDLADELRRATLDTAPQSGDLPPASPGFTRAIQVDMPTAPLTAAEYPRDIRVYGGPWMHEVGLSLELPDGRWLNLGVSMRRAPDRQSPDFLEAFLAMTAAAAALILWAVRRLTAPVRTLAAAAERLGLDVNAAPLPEDGPSEVAKAAAAFNTMAGRIRTFVDNRTFLLTAIGHDLRTPITRLKLRSEFIDDDELRGKFLHDLDELEAMVSATLAFGRDALDREPMAAIDLGALVRTVLDEAGDAHPEAAERLGWDGPGRLVVHASPMALKRAFANLVGNAVAYAGGAQVSARAPVDGVVTVLVEDDGPGVPAELLERVFEPFHRGEPSRSRETGGTGLGLSITRNIVRAHGGDVVLRNRDGGGLRAVVTLRA
ncbi:MAG: ATP-binding protein [Janthinobacterium lividum]